MPRDSVNEKVWGIQDRLDRKTGLVWNGEMRNLVLAGENGDLCFC